jgi:DNA processing protein
MKDDRFYQLALILTPGIGNANAKYLVSHCGSAQSVFECKKKTLLKIPGIGEKTIRSISDNNSFEKTEKVITSCQKQNIRVITYTEEDYPRRLKSILDAPNIIYFQGNGDVNATRSIAIVGTRKATTYGKEITKNIVESCAKYKATIVSGLAYGIDIEAHKNCLNQGLPTFGIIAGGIDMLYPKQHQKIADKMLEAGGILSEQPPGVKPEAHLFPARNRIIAGMTDATIVVEAAVKGGALITANIADSYNRTVFAVPGNLDNPYSMGCNKLIQAQKALIYAGHESLEYNLNWSVDQREQKPRATVATLSHDEQKIVDILINEKSITIDDLAWKSQLQINHTASILLTMEFKDLIKSYPGKKYGLA